MNKELIDLQLIASHMLCELKTNLLIMKEMQEAFTDAKLHIHAKGLDKCIKQTEETIKRAEG